MATILSPYDYDYLKAQESDHVDWPPSKTVEDDSMSVSDILNNYVRGMDVGLKDYPSQDDGISDRDDDYGDETVNLMLDFDSLDLTEIDEIRAALNRRAAQIRRASRSADAPAQVSDVPSPDHGDSESQSDVSAAQA